MHARSGSGANYRRGERSDLVKTWMMRNDKGATDPSKSKELKAQYAEVSPVFRPMNALQHVRCVSPVFSRLSVELKAQR